MDKKMRRRIFGTLIILGMGITLLPGKDIKADPDTPEEVSVTVDCAGDADGNQIVNAKDVTLIRRRLAGGWGVELDEAKVDVDGDGKLSAKDVTIVRRFLAGGWGVSLTKTECHLYSDGHTENFVLDSNNDRRLSYVSKNADGSFRESATWEYDENGRVSKETLNDEYGERVRNIFEYDEYGRETAYTETENSDSAYNYTITYFTDSEPDDWTRASEKKTDMDGKVLLEKEFYSNGVMSYEFWVEDNGTIEKTYREDSSRKTEVHIYNNGESEAWTYDENDHELTKEKIGLDGEVYEAYESSYDKDGNRISEYRKNYRENHEEFIIWEYNEDKVIIKETCMDKPGEGARTQYIRTNFQYDKNGREISYIEENYDEGEPVTFAYTCTYFDTADENRDTRKTEKHVSLDGKSTWEAENYENGQRKSESWTNTDGTVEEKKWDKETGREISWEKKDSENNIIEYRYTEYDEDGNRVKESRKYEDGREGVCTNFIYDDYGREVGYTEVSGGVTYTLTYTYFEDAEENSDFWWRHASESCIGADGSEWQNTSYKNGNRKSETWKNSDGSTGLRNFREDGNCTSEYRKEADGYEEYREWEYDENTGKTSKGTCYNGIGEDKEILYISTGFKYDENGCETEHIEQDYRDGKTYTCTYTYYAPDEQYHEYRTKTEKRESTDKKSIWESEYYENGDRKAESWSDADGSEGWITYAEHWIKTGEYNKYEDGSEEVITFDKNGNDTLKERKDANGNTLETWANSFDSENIKTKEIYTNFEGGFIEESTFNKLGNKLTWVQTDLDGHRWWSNECKYDESGYKTKETQWDGDEEWFCTRTGYTFDKYGREIGYTEENRDGVTYTCSLTYFVDNTTDDFWWQQKNETRLGNDNSEYRIEYYITGQEYKVNEKYSDGSTFEGIYVEDGEASSEYSYDSQGAMTEKYEAEFDEDGNWKSAYYESFLTGNKTYWSLYNWVTENWESVVKREYTIKADGTTEEIYWDIETGMRLYTYIGRLPEDDDEG
ncbi:MAG: dockerin type I repeat-containing protein [Lachnospiraceae bacterium]|nr:dockerin type I repeat-containing protein [Lachnospiraceae bacterium]